MFSFLYGTQIIHSFSTFNISGTSNHPTAPSFFSTFTYNEKISILPVFFTHKYTISSCELSERSFHTISFWISSFRVKSILKLLFSCFFIIASCNKSDQNGNKINVNNDFTVSSLALTIIAPKTTQNIIIIITTSNLPNHFFNLFILFIFS